MDNVDRHTCAACGSAGSLTSKEAVENHNILLAEDDTGALTCLPCYMEKENICLYCSKEADLMPDTSCKAEPWLCEECLNLPYKVHMFSCYGDGCMTPGEYAQEQYRIDAEETEESFLNDD